MKKTKAVDKAPKGQDWKVETSSKDKKSDSKMSKGGKAC